MFDDLWVLFSDYVKVPDSEKRKIHAQYSSGRGRKQGLIGQLISTHPCLSWRLLAHALYQMGASRYVGVGVGGVSCHRALNHLQQKFPTGNKYCKHCNISLGDFPRRGGDVSTTSVFPSPA